MQNRHDLSSVWPPLLLLLLLSLSLSHSIHTHSHVYHFSLIFQHTQMQCSESIWENSNQICIFMCCCLWIRFSIKSNDCRCSYTAYISRPFFVLLLLLLRPSRDYSYFATASEHVDTYSITKNPCIHNKNPFSLFGWRTDRGETQLAISQI